MRGLGSLMDNKGIRNVNKGFQPAVDRPFYNSERRVVPE
jgi:hypothetical protein